MADNPSPNQRQPDVPGGNNQMLNLEERMRRMEDHQARILQLLINPPQPRTPLSRGYQPQDQQHRVDPIEETHMEPPHNHVEVPLTNEELGDTASSAHPSAQPIHNHIPMGILHPQYEDTPRDVIRDEIRRLVLEEFPLRDKQHISRRNFQEFSPLHEVILQHPIPIGFKVPNIEPYDGSSDPYEHVDHYRTIMHIQQASDAVLCQVFPVTLKGQARTWFYSISERTIQNFTHLAKLFVEQFIANRRIIKDSSHLSGIRQNEGETLKEYFQRFSLEARQIPGVDTELLRGVFLGGLRPGPFYSSLMRETVSSYVDLIHRVEAQITADEAINAHRKQFEQVSNKRKNEQDNDNTQRRKHDQQRNQDTSFRPHQQQQRKEYTPLNASRANILMAIQNENNVKWPNPLRPNTGNQEYYCHFHRSQGHTTEACKQLKEEIERLIQQGFLRQFISNQLVKNNNNTDRRQNQPQS